MEESFHTDLLSAHADALQREEPEYSHRYGALFPEEMEELGPLFALAERLYGLFQGPVVMEPAFRSELKAGLIAQAHQQRASAPRRAWQWAALGASAVTVAGVIAAAAWRGSHPSSR